MRRSRHLKLAEETVTVIHGDGSTEQATMIILEDKTPRFDREGYILQDRRYIGNLNKPLFSIEKNDQIRRIQRAIADPRGSTEQFQVLVVEDTEVLWGKQQLQLTDAAPTE